MIAHESCGNFQKTCNKIYPTSCRPILGPDGVDRGVGHALEESLEEPDGDEEAGAGPRGERRHHGQDGGGRDAGQEDPLPAVHGGLGRCHSAMS